MSYIQVNSDIIRVATAANLPLSAATGALALALDTEVLYAFNGTSWSAIATPGVGTGTVTSVAMTVPGALLSVSGSPITGAGTLAVSLPVRVANTIFAGPTTGADAAPTFRALVAADIPSLSQYVLKAGDTMTGKLSISMNGAVNSPVTFLELINTHGQADDEFGIKFSNQGFSGDSLIISHLNPTGITAKLELFTDDTAAISIDGSQNVGIQNRSPGALLDVGSVGIAQGNMRLTGLTSGYVALTTNTNAGSWTMTLPTTPGTNGYVLSTNGSGVTSWVPSGGGGSFPLDPAQQVWFDPNQDSSFQDLIDRAEALAASAITNDIGVAVFAGPNDFSAETSVIKKNLFVIGWGKQATKLGTLTFQATDATHSPRSCGVRGASITKLTATSSDGGVNFDPDFMLGGMVNEDCEIAEVAFSRTNVVTFNNCIIRPGATVNNFNICEEVLFEGCILAEGGDLVWTSDDSDANPPSTYAGGNPVPRNTICLGNIKIVQGGGAVANAYLQAQNSRLNIIQDGDTDYRIEGGDVASFSITSGIPNFLDWPANSPTFKPTQSKLTIVDHCLSSDVDSPQAGGPFGWHYASMGVNSPPSYPESNTKRLGSYLFSVNSTGDLVGMQANISAVKIGTSKVTFAFALAVDSGAPTTDDDYHLFAGLADNDPSGGGQAAVFWTDKSVSATNWLTLTNNGGTPSVQDTGVAISGSSYFNFRIETFANGSQIRYYINGSLVVIESVNIPNDSIGPTVQMKNLNLTNFNDLCVDWAMLEFISVPGTGVY